MGRNLSYLMKTINVYNLYVKPIFHADAGHYPVYCLTKRNDNEKEDLKLWTSPSKNVLQSHWRGVIRDHNNPMCQISVDSVN